MSKLPPTLNITDQEIDTSNFSEEWKTKVFSFCNELEQIINRDKERSVFAIGGPSGATKSTTAAVLKYILLPKVDSKFLTVSLDAYHYSNKYLIEHDLMKTKGSYQTYNTVKLKENLQDFCAHRAVKFPKYSRKIHNPIDGGESVVENEKATLILEGLWLLYDKLPWKEFVQFYDYKLYMSPAEEFAREAVIARHMRGGKSNAEAVKFYENSDLKNTKLIGQYRVAADKIIKI